MTLFQGIAHMWRDIKPNTPKEWACLCAEASLLCFAAVAPSLAEGLACAVYSTACGGN